MRAHVSGRMTGGVLLLLLVAQCLAAPEARQAVRGVSAQKPRRKSSSSAASKSLHVDAFAVSQPGVELTPLAYEEAGALQKDAV